MKIQENVCTLHPSDHSKDPFNQAINTKNEAL